jgi:hypothetical protein
MCTSSKGLVVRVLCNGKGSVLLLPSLQDAQSTISLLEIEFLFPSKPDLSKSRST